MKNTKIEWTDHTFNPWIGCTKVSAGCAHCYAETLMDTRWGRVKWGKGNPRQRTSAANWKLPLQWNTKSLACDECGHQFSVNNRHFCFRSDVPRIHRARVFCASLADWLDDEVPIEWLADLLSLIRITPHLDWLLLTKRPENWEKRINAAFDHTHGDDWQSLWTQGEAPENIWLGVSVEDQAAADKRIPLLLQIPAKVRFLSCEPLLGHLNFDPHWLGAGGRSGDNYQQPQIHWVIFGGESGGGSRQCDVGWIRHGVHQCRAAGVAVFVKQLGGNVIDRNDAGFEGDPGEWPMDTHTEDDPYTACQGDPVRVLLRNKKGGDMAEWVPDLCKREFPELP